MFHLPPAAAIWLFIAALILIMFWLSEPRPVARYFKWCGIRGRYVPDNRPAGIFW